MYKFRYLNVHNSDRTDRCTRASLSAGSNKISFPVSPIKVLLTKDCSKASLISLVLSPDFDLSKYYTGQMLSHSSFVVFVFDCHHLQQIILFLFIVSISVLSIKLSFILKTLLKPFLPSSKTSTCFWLTASLKTLALLFLFYLTICCQHSF